MSEDYKVKEGWGRDLPGKVWKMWPKDGEGNPEEPAFLKHCSSVDMEDELLINMLTAYGVPCIKINPMDGCFGKVVLGMSGSGTDILVPKSLAEDARALMEGKADE